MKKIFFLLLLILMIAILPFLLPKEEEIIKVRAEKIRFGLAQDLVLSNSAGAVEANRKAIMSSTIQGKIVKIYFRNNDKIPDKACVLEFDSKELVEQKKIYDENELLGTAICSIGLVLALCSVYIFTRRQMVNLLADKDKLD